MKLTANDKSLLERVAKSPVTYVYEPLRPDGKQGALLRSSSSTKLIAALNRFALAGLVSQRWAQSSGREPPQRTLSFTITALGRDAIELHQPIKPPVNRSTPKTMSQMLAEANERE